jgi:hypothetical protein
MSLGFNQSLTEINTRNLPLGGRGARPERKVDNLNANLEKNVYKMWEPRHPPILWDSFVSYKENFPFCLYISDW